MIGKGAQYLTAAGFGRYRITAASLGSLDMLGTSRWLKPWATQAIMAAFGVDGPAVIQATNKYLNGIAASDKAKATALAGFINEDPMMVCSLGLEPQGVTMPVRWLVGDGTAYLNANITLPDDNIKVEFIVHKVVPEPSGWHLMFGRRYGSGNGYFGLHLQGSTLYANLGSNANKNFGVSWSNILDRESTFEASGGRFKLLADDTIVKEGTYSGSVGEPRETNFAIYAWYQRDAGGYLFISKYGYGKYNIISSGNLVRAFLPFRLGKAWSADKVSTGVAQAKDTLGMIDLVTGIFYPNAASSGAFTMEGEPTP